MRIIYILALCFFSSFNFLNAQNNFWKVIDEQSIAQRSENVREIVPAAYNTLTLDLEQFKTALRKAPKLLNHVTPESTPLSVTLPMPDGSFEQFEITNASIMAKELQEKTPYIQTFSGYSKTDPTAFLTLDYTLFGFHAMIISQKFGTIYIDPYAKNDTEHYISYTRKDFYKTNKERMVCGMGEMSDEVTHTAMSASARTGGDCQLRIYRLAFACTGEYAIYHGGTLAGAKSAMATTLNRVNAIFQKENGIKLELIAGNDVLVYLNAGSDPYTNSNPFLMLSENQANTNTIIMPANYDIGHVLGTGGGGYGAYNSPCVNSEKAEGVSASSTPSMDPFDVDYVCHEIGHQFGAYHTFSASGAAYDNCKSSTISLTTSVEPGSGSTIMSYAGICLAADVQENSDPYFNAISLAQISTNIVSGNSSTCPMQPVTANTAPTANAGANYSIPISTPFTLTGAGNDPNGNPITYCWEQTDVTNPAVAFPFATQTQGAVFRSFPPVTSPSRTFPKMADIVNNINPTWEKLPSVARTLNFRLTTRDNQLPAGCTGEANMTVTTVATGNPFEVTAPTVSGLSFNGGSMQTVTWNVVGTTAAPISCANVDILLSTDGGLTYPTTILTATANDGTENITMPNITTTTARIMIRANGNIFFDISNNDFAITAVVLPIELISFKALPLDKSIRLDWKTASENNNRGFELQRRSDTESNFEKIAWIKGNGTTTRENSYTYSDEKVQPNKTYYYRLHQIDEDGKGTFSKVEVAALNKNGLWGMELQPNPAREQIGVTLFGNTNEVNRYRLVSINGQIVQEGTFLEKYNTLNINELPNGVYFIQVSNENNILTKKIIKD